MRLVSISYLKTLHCHGSSWRGGKGDARQQNPASSSHFSGKEILKAVPLLPGRMLLLTRIRPLWRSMMRFDKARPRPVPLSALVVKNGWKRVS